ncbi:hypothetical protein DM01DRAFT_1405397 [Hesseltinella vesiculosa]|uniref:Uncharacterized protein n=1 Tax=Hesseltinella vesiculosa TaxID=101127 RepID=A0A1X2GPT4_9FUNG|nr:hypothetical protein DM01DRAFT_1405397 [Hesseltinella vesiculosa]
MPVVSQLQEAFAIAGSNLDERRKAVAQWTTVGSCDWYYYQGLILLQELSGLVQNQTTVRAPTAQEQVLMTQLDDHFTKAKKQYGPTQSDVTLLESRFYLLTWYINQPAASTYMNTMLSLQLPSDRPNRRTSTSEPRPNFRRNPRQASVTQDENSASLQPHLPSVLDASLLDLRSVFQELLKNKDSFSVTPAVWSLLIKDAWSTLRETDQLNFLQSVVSNGPLPEDINIVDFIVDYWKRTNASARGGGWDIQLATFNFTLKQLDQLFSKMSSFFKTPSDFRSSLINTYLQKLVPDSYLQGNAVITVESWNALDTPDGRAYLDKVDTFADKSLADGRPIKARVSFERLRMTLVAKKFDVNLLIVYLSQSFVKKGALPSLSPLPRNQKFGKLQHPYKHLENDIGNITIPLLGNCSVSSADEMSLIEHYVRGLVLQKKVSDLHVLDKYLDYDTYLDPLLARIMLTSQLGAGKDINQWISRLDRSATFENLEKASCIKFGLSTVHDEDREVKPDASLSLDVVLKNIPRLALRIFPLDLFNYWKAHASGFSIRNAGSISLDGLQPILEKDFDYSSLHTMHIHEETYQMNQLAPELFQGKRGVWLVDLVGGEHQARAIIHKGYLRHIEQKTPAGHLFLVLDEKNQTTPARIWYEKSFYEPDEHGNILIPYRTDQSQRGRCLFVTDDGYCQPIEFFHELETYYLESAFCVNKESMLPNKQATVVIKPTLNANGKPCSLSLLENVSLQITTTTDNDIPSSSNTPDIKISTDGIIEHTFTVPSSVARVEFLLEAKVKQVNGELKTVSSTYSYRHNISDLISNTYLRRDSQIGYYLLVLGKNGEPVPDVKLEVSFQLPLLNRDKVVSMQTSKEGRILLGKLPNVGQVTVNTLSFHSWSVNNDGQQSRLPSNLYWTENTPICLPYKQQIVDWCLYRNGAYGNVYEDLTQLLVKKDTLIEIPRGLPKGSYSLFTSDKRIELTVLGESVKLNNNPAWKGWVFDDQSYLKPSHMLTKPLVVDSLKVTRDHVTLQLNKNSPHCVAVVSANVFLPNLGDSVFSSMGSSVDAFQRNSASIYLPQLLRSVFLTGRTLSEEHQYILNREKAPKYVGSTLPDPSLLVYPEKKEKTVAKTRTNKEGNKHFVGDRGERSNNYGNFASRAFYDVGSILGNVFSNQIDFGFLCDTKPVFVIPVDPANGPCVIPTDKFGQGNFVQITLLSQEHIAGLEVTIPSENKALAMFDNRRLDHGLDIEGCYVRTKMTNVLSSCHQNASLTLDLAQHEFEIIGSQDDMLRHLTMLAPGCRSTLDEYKSVLLKWSTLSLDEKHANHAKLGCHEFNLWLKYKDTSYFDSHVRPCLQNKVQHDFMDAYLLDEDLTKYGERLVYFKKLSVLELALLCKRVPAAYPAVHRQFMQEVEKITSHQAFDTVLAGRALETNASINEMGFDGSDSYSEDVVTMAANLSGTLPQGEAVYSQLQAVPMAFSAPPPPMGFGAAVAGGAAAIGAGVSAQPASLFGGVAPKAKKMMMSLRSAAAPEADTLDDEEAEEEGLPDGDNDDAEYQDQLRELARERLKQREPYKYMEPTWKWAEQGYRDTTVLRGKISPFWLDYIENKLPLFLSKNIIYATNSFTEIMFALAVTDLPLSAAADYDLSAVPGKLTVNSKSTPVIVFCRDLRQLEKEDTNKLPSLLISQSFFDSSAYSVVDENTRLVDPDQLMTQTKYGWHVAVTNVTPKPVYSEITLQVPPGAIPLFGTRPCISKTITIKPYSTLHEVIGQFYFPVQGSFRTFPITISTTDEVKQSIDLLTSSPSTTLTVTDLYHVYDQTTGSKRGLSWAVVAANAPDQEVLEYLTSDDIELDKLDWSLVLSRMTNASFAEPLLKLLRTNKIYNKQLYGFGVYHLWSPVIVDLLHNESYLLLENTGTSFESPLVQWQPFDLGKQQVLDYFPIVNARAHSLASEPEIANQDLHDTYIDFIKYLTGKTSMVANDYLILTVYLLNQGRLADAHRVNGELKARLQQQGSASSIQMDYVDAYLATRPAVGGTVDWQQIKSLVAKHKDTSSKHWKDRFDALAKLARGVENDSMVDDLGGVGDHGLLDDETKMRRDPVFDFVIKDDRVVLRYANVTEAEVRFYKINAEVMFSNEPFLGQGNNKASLVSWFHANHVEKIDLTRPIDEIENVVMVDAEDDLPLTDWIAVHKVQPKQIALPIKLKGNLLIEIHAHGKSQRQTYMSNDLMVHVSEGYGLARVMKDQTPLAGVYVKVYAYLKHETSGGLFGRTVTKKSEFWKDGYTSLTGIFDYVSVTQGNPVVGQQDLKSAMDRVEKFALLFSSPEHGVVVKEAYPPL